MMNALDITAGRAVITGAGTSRRRSLRRWLALLGPAFVAAVAYVDPGNFATNSTAGARYGLLLVWVVVLANLIAMLVQTLSAKLGLATGMSLPELCRQRCSRPVTWLMWAQAELVAAATDVAEVIGGAVGLHLLFGIPLARAGLVIAVASFGILALRMRGARRFEAAIMALLGVIVTAFAVNLASTGLHPASVMAGLVPRLAGPDSLLLATGILGATVMPHVVYVHSALTRDRYPAASDTQRRTAFRAIRVDVLLALGCAGAVNLAMLLVASGVFHGPDASAADTLAGAHAGLVRSLGTAAGAMFAIALLVSGLASTSVGTFAGEVIMSGYLRRHVPILLRRLVTVAPALAILAVGTEPTTALVLSQVVLSFGIPFALIPLVWLTRQPAVMGALVNHRLTTAAAALVTVLVVGLNTVLLSQLA
jgi:manganese transport protein